MSLTTIKRAMDAFHKHASNITALSNHNRSALLTSEDAGRYKLEVQWYGVKKRIILRIITKGDDASLTLRVEALFDSSILFLLEEVRSLLDQDVERAVECFLRLGSR